MTRILKVDDHAELLEAMITLLYYSGYTIHTASNNQTFLAEFEKFKPGIVLIDVRMDAEDGREICKTSGRIMKTSL